MNAPDKAREIKAALTLVISFLTALWGWQGWAIAVFISSMTMDYITGTWAARARGEWSSAAARAGLWHKLGEITALLVAALCSTIISMLPFKFNERIERAVDDTIDHGIEDMRALGNRMSEWNEHHRRHPRKPTATAPETPPTEPGDKANTPTTPPPLTIDPEDPSRFMPK